MEFLNGSYLFDSMFAEDPEAAKIGHLPKVAALVQTYLLLIYLIEMYVTLRLYVYFHDL